MLLVVLVTTLLFRQVCRWGLEVHLCCRPVQTRNLHGSGMSHATTASLKPSLGAPWRAGEAVVGRGNAGWTTSKSEHSCPCQNCSQWPPAEKTGRGPCWIVSHVPQTTQSAEGLNWIEPIRSKSSAKRSLHIHLSPMEMNVWWSWSVSRTISGNDWTEWVRVSISDGHMLWFWRTPLSDCSRGLHCWSSHIVQ